MELKYQTHTKVYVGTKNKKDEITKSHKSLGYDDDVPSVSMESIDITSVRLALFPTPTHWHQELMSTRGAGMNSPNAC